MYVDPILIVCYVRNNCLYNNKLMFFLIIITTYNFYVFLGAKWFVTFLNYQSIFESPILL